MFKYLWIIVLVIVVLAFIGYTVYAIKNVIDSAKETDTFLDLFGRFIWDYEVLVGVWAFIFIFTCIASFAAWVMATCGG